MYPSASRLLEVRARVTIWLSSLHGQTHKASSRNPSARRRFLHLQRYGRGVAAKTHLHDDGTCVFQSARLNLYFQTLQLARVVLCGRLRSTAFVASEFSASRALVNTAVRLCTTARTWESRQMPSNACCGRGRALDPRRLLVPGPHVCLEERCKKKKKKKLSSILDYGKHAYNTSNIRII